MYYWLFKLAVFKPLVQLLYAPRVVGRENLPQQGGAVIAANHTYAMDSIVLPAMVPRRMTYPAKAELFRPSKDPRRAILAWFLKAIGVLPLNRDGGRESAAGLGPVSRALESGVLLGIYPEGTRSVDGRLWKGKTGVARLALHADVPVVPVGIVWGPPRGPLPRRPEVRIGKPLSWPQYTGRDDDRDVLRWVTDDVMAAIQDLTGQEYVDAYGVTRKTGQLTAEAAEGYRRDNPHARATPPPANPGQA